MNESLGKIESMNLYIFCTIW